MAIRTWVGGASAVAQVWKGTITTTTAGHTYIVTLTDLNRAGSTVVFTYTLVSGDTTVTIAAASFVTAWNASVAPLVSGITASSSAGIITLTADSAGVPFSAATSGTGTWSATGNTQENSGPYDYGLAANWAENAVPASGDEVIITGTNRILYRLNQSAVDVDSFAVTSYSGTIGASGSPLVIDTDALVFSGTGEAHIDVGSSAIAPAVYGSSSGTASSYTLHLTGSAMTTLTNYGGAVAIAPSTGQTATVATINNENGVVLVGSGVTLTTFNQASGTGTIRCAATTVSASTGTLRTEGTGAITTLNAGTAIGGGTATLNSTGTITTLNARGGTVDFSGNRTARTVTTLNLYNGATVIRDPAVITVGTLTQSDASSLAAS